MPNPGEHSSDRHDPDKFDAEKYLIDDINHVLDELQRQVFGDFEEPEEQSRANEEQADTRPELDESTGHHEQGDSSRPPTADQHNQAE